MKQFKYFLIAISLLAFPAHATTFECNNDKFDIPANMKISVEPRPCAVNPIMSKTFPGFGTRKPEETLGAYCQGGKQKLAMSIHAKILMPKLPKGLALDEASKLQMDVRNKAQESVSYVFYSAAPRAYMSQQVPEYYAAPTKDLSKFFQEAELSKKPYEVDYNVAFATVVDGDGFVIGLANAFQRRGFYKDSPEEKPLSVPFNDANSRKKIFSLTPYNDSLVAQEVVYTDLQYLISSYIPMSDSDIAHALDAKEQIWSDYLRKHIQTKIAQTNDPSVLQATASLDLNDFCKTERAVTDLTSQ